MNMKKIPCAYPIITCDPFFSVWFDGKNPTECDTVHWSGRSMPIRITAVIDGREYGLFGNNSGKPVMNYVGSQVTALRTVFEYELGETKLSIGFLTAQFLDDLDTVTLPISYIYYECNRPVKVMLAVSTAIATDERSQYVIACGKDGYAFAETEGGVPLSRSGDCICAGWGKAYLMHESAKVQGGRYSTDNLPYMTASSDKQSDHFTLGYDDIESMRFMGKVLPAYWRTKQNDFVQLMTSENKKFDFYLAKAVKFDADLISEAVKVSDDYADIVSLAYRQSIAAHKLVVGEDGLYFVSKENSSNGCGATLDVTYPSIPLYLKYNPELVRAMLRPLFKFALSPLWHYDFAPHDCGQYPLLDAQAYGKNPDGSYDFNMQMPVEECGNAIICLAAACFADNKFDFAAQNEKLIRKYVDYLIKNGYNPDNQLCTDDFAGHLPHNCNLSVKAIVAIAAAGKLYGDDGYCSIAKDMADRFTAEAMSSKGGTRLTFDDDGGWSLKYNMIWDKLMNLGLFDEAIYNAEAVRYEAESHTFGTPLDCRKDYTKTDWLVWCAAMCGGEYELKTYERIALMISETKDRYAFTDWYDTANANNSGFKARSVIGGVFIRLILNVIETRRLKIYVAGKEQMESYISLQTDDEMRAAYTEMLDGCLSHPTQWKWYAIWMIELHDGTHVGDICFKGVSSEGKTEIGYGISEEYQGCGYATEAVSAAVDWALMQPGITCITAEAVESNFASIRVLTKAGFTKTGKYGAEGLLFERRKTT